MTSPDWRNRIVGQGEADAADLLPNPDNWRIHPRAQRKAMAGVLNEVGWVQQVIVNKTTGHLIDGHMRVDMARDKGERVPYVMVELTEDEERLILATLDPLSTLAQPDDKALERLLGQVASEGDDLTELLKQVAAAGDDSPVEPALEYLTIAATPGEIRELRDRLLPLAPSTGKGDSEPQRLYRAIASLENDS